MAVEPAQDFVDLRRRIDQGLPELQQVRAFPLRRRQGRRQRRFAETAQALRRCFIAQTQQGRIRLQLIKAVAPRGQPVGQRRKFGLIERVLIDQRPVAAIHFFERSSRLDRCDHGSPAFPAQTIGHPPADRSLGGARSGRQPARQQLLFHGLRLLQQSHRFFVIQFVVGTINLVQFFDLGAVTALDRSQHVTVVVLEALLQFIEV